MDNYLAPMSDMRKITVSLPAHLIDVSLQGSGKGLTETIRLALEEHNHRLASQRLHALRGKIKFDVTYEEMAGKNDEDRV